MSDHMIAKTAEGIINGSPIPMFVLNKHHKITHWNRACELLTGFNRDEMIGTERQWEPFYPEKRPILADLLIDDKPDEIRSLYREMNLRRSALIDGAYEAEYFFPHIGPQGTQLYLNAAPIKDDSGQIQGAIVTYQDLSEIHELRKEKEQAEQLAAVSRTLAGLAHYIKNILNGLSGGAYVIRSAIGKKDMDLVTKGWHMVEKNIDQIAQIVMDMMIYTKDRKPRYQMVNPNDLVKEIVELMAERAGLSGVTVQQDLDAEMTEIAMDKSAIYRCLLNLVSNAIDACTLTGLTEGKGEVMIRSEMMASHNIKIEVVDNGTGMDPGTQKKVFTDFFSTKGYQGTGLGLPVTQKIVKEHGGALTCRSRPGKGTAFSMVLPRKTVSPHPEEPQDTPSIGWDLEGWDLF